MQARNTSAGRVSHRIKSSLGLGGLTATARSVAHDACGRSVAVTTSAMAKKRLHIIIVGIVGNEARDVSSLQQRKVISGGLSQGIAGEEQKLMLV